MPRRKEPPEPPPIHERLNAADQATRLAALGELLRPDADPAPHRQDITDRLQDEQEAVRKLAVLLLATLGAAHELGLALEEKQPVAIRLAAASCLGQLGPKAEPATAPLCRSIRSRADQLRFLSSFALGKIGAPAVLPLRRLLVDPEPSVLCAVVDALGWIGTDAQPSVPEIERLAGHPDAKLRLACPAALIKITGKASAGIPALTRNLEESDDEEIRAESAHRLAGLRDAAKDARPALLAATKDRSPKVRAKSAVALVTTGVPAPQAVEAVSPLLRDTDADVRAHAAMSLAHLGPEARQALPELRRLYQDPNERVVAVSKAAVERIDAPAKS